VRSCCLLKRDDGPGKYQGVRSESRRWCVSVGDGEAKAEGDVEGEGEDAKAGTVALSLAAIVVAGALHSDLDRQVRAAGARWQVMQVMQVANSKVAREFGFGGRDI
jgi:hypothetical protein